MFEIYSDFGEYPVRRDQDPFEVINMIVDQNIPREDILEMPEYTKKKKSGEGIVRLKMKSGTEYNFRITSTR